MNPLKPSVWDQNLPVDDHDFIVEPPEGDGLGERLHVAGEAKVLA